MAHNAALSTYKDSRNTYAAFFHHHREMCFLNRGITLNSALNTGAGVKIFIIFGQLVMSGSEGVSTIR